MSTKRTFEDRLLDELHREIEVRQAGVCRTGPAETATGEGTLKASGRRLFAPRRIAVTAAACAAAWLTTVVVPGSPTDSRAYAVERHGDGSVTLTIEDQSIDIEAQRELARQLRPNGIGVTVSEVAPGYMCQRSKPRELYMTDEQGEPVGKPVAVWTWEIKREIKLFPGHVLAFENTTGSNKPYAVITYFAKSKVEPCVPVRRPNPEG
ncbi:hypothetical protein [Streptomyces cadmiisoli]|uniref:hypothetical protein n=1 Tax=Streptomyces cadmiisoli TaxID=2184053 RepID=UPI003D7490EA